MNHGSETEALTALGHADRLAVFRLLARHAPQEVRPGDLARALGLKPNTLSVHLATLSRAGLVTSRREGKAVLYRIDLERTSALIRFLVTDCCRGRPELCAPLAEQLMQHVDREGRTMAGGKLAVAFICTGNSARSIMAESILRHEAGERFDAYSAGTRPAAAPHPLALDLLREEGHDIAKLRSKNLDELQAPSAPQLDFVFTVCDRAANEECPVWPGHPLGGHWGLPDPAAVEGGDAERKLAFRRCFDALRDRITAFAALPFASLDRLALQGAVDAIGRADTGAAA